MHVAQAVVKFLTTGIGALLFSALLAALGPVLSAPVARLLDRRSKQADSELQLRNTTIQSGVGNVATTTQLIDRRDQRDQSRHTMVVHAAGEDGTDEIWRYVGIGSLALLAVIVGSVASLWVGTRPLWAAAALAGGATGCYLISRRRYAGDLRVGGTTLVLVPLSVGLYVLAWRMSGIRYHGTDLAQTEAAARAPRGLHPLAAWSLMSSDQRTIAVVHLFATLVGCLVGVAVVMLAVVDSLRARRLGHGALGSARTFGVGRTQLIAGVGILLLSLCVASTYGAPLDAVRNVVDRSAAVPSTQKPQLSGHRHPGRRLGGGRHLHGQGDTRPR